MYFSLNIKSVLEQGGFNSDIYLFLVFSIDQMTSGSLAACVPSVPLCLSVILICGAPSKSMSHYQAIITIYWLRNLDVKLFQYFCNIL